MMVAGAADHKRTSVKNENVFDAFFALSAHSNCELPGHRYRFKSSLG